MVATGIVGLLRLRRRSCSDCAQDDKRVTVTILPIDPQCPAAVVVLRNFPMLSFKNFESAGFGAAPAVCPQSDGIGMSVTPGINAASYFASPTGKYRSVSEGM